MNSEPPSCESSALPPSRQHQCSPVSVGDLRDVFHERFRDWRACHSSDGVVRLLLGLVINPNVDVSGAESQDKKRMMKLLFS